MLQHEIPNSFLTSFFLSCADINQKISSPRSDRCACEKDTGSSVRFVATNVHVVEAGKKNPLNFNCADTETAIASISGPDGNEFCLNLYDVKYISNVDGIVILSEKFYYSEEGSVAETTPKLSRNLIYKQIGNSEKKYFEFYFDEKGEVVFVYKLKVD